MDSAWYVIAGADAVVVAVLVYLSLEAPFGGSVQAAASAPMPTRPSSSLLAPRRWQHRMLLVSGYLSIWLALGAGMLWLLSAGTEPAVGQHGAGTYASLTLSFAAVAVVLLTCSGLLATRRVDGDRRRL